MPNSCGNTCSLDASFVGVTARYRRVTSCLLLTPWEYHRQLLTVWATYFPRTCCGHYPQIYGTHKITHTFSSLSHVTQDPHHVTLLLLSDRLLAVGLLCCMRPLTYRLCSTDCRSVWSTKRMS